jgi:hypothetical protein
MYRTPQDSIPVSTMTRRHSPFAAKMLLLFLLDPYSASSYAKGAASVRLSLPNSVSLTGIQKI